MIQCPREKDFRRIGYIFDDDTILEMTNMTAAENWKSVMAELHEKKIKSREESRLSKPRKPIDSSFDSGIQQEYNSDNDEVCNSICMTLNRLVELSKEQQLQVNYSGSLSSIAEIDRLCSDNLSINCTKQYARAQNGGSKSNFNVDCLSTSSYASETNNLVEEVFMKNSCSNENTIQIPCHTNLGRHSDQSSLSISHRHKSNSAQNLSSKNSTKDQSIGSSSSKRIYVKNNTKSRIPSSTFCNLNVVVTIDIGSAYSGFAYNVNDLVPENIRIMQKYKDHHMKKIPSVLLLNAKTEFHSFGNEARNYFLHVEENSSCLSSQWLLFEKFKMQLMNSYDINRECEIKAVNGISIPALIVYSRTLNYFKCLAIHEISNFLQHSVDERQVQWIVSIPVTWSVKGKVFIQEAAINAGLCSVETTDKLLVVYEAEAVATWCNILNWNVFTEEASAQQNDVFYFLVMNCGGGNIDISLHETRNKNHCIISEIHKPSELIYCSCSIRDEFIQLLSTIFGVDVINLIRYERPALLTDLFQQFESCKIYSSDSSHKLIDIHFNQYFIDFYYKITGTQVSQPVMDVHLEEIAWNENGAMSISISLLRTVFQPLLQKIIKFVQQILKNRKSLKPLSRMYCTGGLTKFEFFREELESTFSDESLIFFPEAAELCVMKGSIQKFKQENFKLSKMPYSYAIGVIKEFQEGIHPLEKLVMKDGRRWCCDLLDWLVRKDQTLSDGEVILKRYTPTTSHQSCIVINIYAVEQDDSKFVTDHGVHSCGVLRLSTTPTDRILQHEILLQLIFTKDEFVINALDTLTGNFDRIQLDNLSYL